MQATQLDHRSSAKSERPDSSNPEERIRDLVEPVARAVGCELLDVELIGAGGTRILRVVLDHEDGVTVDLCADVSRRLSPLLDVEDPVPGSYQLEVSSPGLNRPLKRETDYIRHLGQRVKIETRRPLPPEGRRKRFSGILGDFRDGLISLTLDSGEHIEIPFEQVRKANLIYDFDNP